MKAVPDESTCVLELDELRTPLPGCVACIGNFDGVHAGHRAILSCARRAAERFKAPVVALTFEPHPLVVVAPARAPATLTPLSEKAALLGRAGADQVIVARSTPELLKKSPRAFVEEIVVGRLGARCVVEGVTFGFGAGRRGDVKLLSELGNELSFTVQVVGPVFVTLPDGQRVQVSSSLVRRYVSEGAVEAARACLGRCHVLTGTVEPGRGRGRSLGYATANLRCDDQLIPGEGVFAGFAKVQDAWRGSAVSIGRTPTFGGDRLQVEAHLFDLDSREALYGRSMRVAFVGRLRDQRRFTSAAALKGQIAADIEQSRRILAAVRTDELD